MIRACDSDRVGVESNENVWREIHEECIGYERASPLFLVYVPNH